MIMNFLKKTVYEQVYQKRTLIVTQAYNVNLQKNNRIMNINKLQIRHTIEDVLFRFDFLMGVIMAPGRKVAMKRYGTSE